LKLPGRGGAGRAARHPGAPWQADTAPQPSASSGCSPGAAAHRGLAGPARRWSPPPGSPLQETKELGGGGEKGWRRSISARGPVVLTERAGQQVRKREAARLLQQGRSAASSSCIARERATTLQAREKGSQGRRGGGAAADSLVTTVGSAGLLTLPITNSWPPSTSYRTSILRATGTDNKANREDMWEVRTRIGASRWATGPGSTRGIGSRCWQAAPTGGTHPRL
jgi:hypothetical protein